jgi:regulator of cell morphogenesis and NO signaling
MSAVDLTPDSTLADVVDAAPGTARLLESLGLDSCCGGARSLADACAAAGVDAASVLEAATIGAPEPAEWSVLPIVQLVDHIEATHHAYLHAELPRLRALAAKVAGVHGGHHPESAHVLALVDAIRADLEPHLLKEERVLFPMIRELATSSAAPSFHCGSIRNPIAKMTMEHDRAGSLLAELRRTTRDYEVPADACASYRMLYLGLRELEADTHLHVHKENNHLFPAAVDAERRLVDRS